MNEHLSAPTRNQTIFREMVLGTLLYAVVLGFFADYTDFLSVKSYSTTFLAAILLQILTYLTLGLKTWIIAKFRGKTGAAHRTALVLSVWLVMFLSKFVFLWALDIAFSPNFQISGFAGLVLIILTMLVAQQLIDLVYRKLG